MKKNHDKYRWQKSEKQTEIQPLEHRSHHLLFLLCAIYHFTIGCISKKSSTQTKTFSESFSSKIFACFVSYFLMPVPTSHLGKCSAFIGRLLHMLVVTMKKCDTPWLLIYSCFVFLVHSSILKLANRLYLKCWWNKFYGGKDWLKINSLVVF